MGERLWLEEKLTPINSVQLLITVDNHNNSWPKLIFGGIKLNINIHAVALFERLRFVGIFRQS